jgi:glutamate formiminotransferase
VLDVAPLVWLADGEREAAREAAMKTAEGIAERVGLPVFLYGELATSEERRERSFFRRGGLEELRRRMAAGELAADFGPAHPHPSAGATLVTARAPLAAFNLVLDGVNAEAAKAIAARLRESGGGLPGVRAIAIDLGSHRMQISANVHDPIAVPVADVIARVRELAADPGNLASGEIVGLVPESAMAGFPADVPLLDFDPDRQLIERRLAAS